MVELLARTARPANLIAGNGMCLSGRIVNYFKAILGDSRHNLLFADYRAAGTLGQTIQRDEAAGGYVDINKFDITAGIKHRRILSPRRQERLAAIRKRHAAPAENWHRQWRSEGKKTRWLQGWMRSIKIGNNRCRS